MEYAQRGNKASFGRDEIDESSQRFTYSDQGAMVRRLLRKGLARPVGLYREQLIVEADVEVVPRMVRKDAGALSSSARSVGD